MNQRIRELAEQAGFYFYDMHDVDGQDLGETIEADSWTAAEKFAELIVRECVGVVEGGRFLHDQAPTAQFARECSDAIKRHFGVE